MNVMSAAALNPDQLPLLNDERRFTQRMLYPSFADHQITPDIESRVRRAFEQHLGADGASFVRPMHVRLLRRRR